ncbi:MAG: hypothetical protein ABI039_15070 [Vicinamibacterales bacterium]
MSSRNSLAIVMVTAALLLVLISSMIDLRQIHGDLESAIGNQKAARENSSKVEAQLDSLAKGLSQLAQTGNQNAQHIVGMLKQNGVDIKANSGSE